MGTSANDVSGATPAEEYTPLVTNESQLLNVSRNDQP
jgi:hypothetical protein